MATRSGLTVKRDTVKKSLDAIKKLTGLDVLVGIPSDKAERDDDSPLNNAQLAYIHTYGATIKVPEHEATIYRAVDANGDFKKGGQFVKKKKSNFATTHVVPEYEVTIPPRPFLEPGVKNATPRVTPILKKAASLAAGGDITGAKRQLESAGLTAQTAVQAVFGSGVHVPLADSTLRKRRAKGRTGDVPLVDTGELRNHITYVVREKK